MGYILAGIVIGAVVIAVLIATQNTKGTSTERAGNYTYSRRELLSPAETLFYNALRLTLSEEYLIWPKMGLWAAVRNNERGGWQKISQKHIDFVIVLKSSLKTVAAIELDDTSHNSEAAIKRDTEKNSILESAGINLIRIQAKRSYNQQELKAILSKNRINTIETTPANTGTVKIPVPPVVRR